MKMLRNMVVSVLVFAPIVAAQLHIGGLTADPGAPVDFSASTATTPTAVGTNLPGTCGVGQQFFKSNNSAGTELYLCTATNTWTQITSGGGGGLLDPGANGVMKRTALNTTAAATATDVSALNYIAGSGTAQAQVATLTTPITSLSNGLSVCWLPAAANTGAAPTLAVNGLTAKPITKYGTAALVANDLTTTAVACAVYDGTEFQLQNPQMPPVSVKINGGAVVGPQPTLNLIPGTGLAGFTGVVNGSQIDVTLPLDTSYLNTNYGKFTTNPQTANYQVLASDFTSCKSIPVASGTFTITLVASGSQPPSGQCILIINYGSGAVTVARSGQNINGAAANLVLAAGSAAFPTGLFVISDGTNYEAQPLGGTTFPTAVSTQSLTGQTAAIAATNLQCGGAICAAGQYRLTAYLDSTASCATSGPAAVGLTLTWTDEAGTKTAQAVPIAVSGSASLLTAMPLGDTTHYATGFASLWTSGSNNIQYATTYTACTTGTGTYALRLVTERLQ